jgi:primosomal protein N' (replication factor Y)
MSNEGLRTFAEVAVDGMQPGSVSPTLTYCVPDLMVADLSPGCLVWVPLRKNAALGVVIGCHQIEPDFVARPIFEVLPASFALNGHQLAFGRWLQRETASSLFACLKLWMPPGVEHTLTPWFELRNRPDQLTRQQSQVVDLLAVNGSMSLDQLQAAIGSSLASNIPELEQRGAISRRYQSEVQVHRPRTERWWIARDCSSPVKLTVRQREVLDVIADAGVHGVRAGEVIDRTGASQSIPGKLIELGLVTTEDRPILPSDDVRPYGSIPNLTSEQASIWSLLERELAAPSGRTQVLFGITGSGKTELYLRAIAAMLRRGKGAILLVPEIALTGQIAQRVRERFPGRVAVLHSGMAMGIRQESWFQVESGQRQTVIGPRSALFAPVQNLGLIILDE